MSETPAPDSKNQKQLSWDFVPLQRVKTARIHVLLAETKKPPGMAHEPPWVSTNSSHAAGYGAALRLFQPLSDLILLTAALPFSDR
jgi:hypothetical protein